MYKQLLKSCVLLIVGILVLWAAIVPTSSNAYELVNLELTLVKSLRHPVREYVKGTDSIANVSWSPDGTYLATADSNGEIYVWKSEDWSLVTNFHCLYPVYGDGFAWSPTQPLLVVGCMGTEGIIETPSLNDELTIIKIETYRQGLAWSADGSKIAVPQEDNTIGILNDSFQLLYTLGDPQPIISSIEEAIAYCCDHGGLHYMTFEWSPLGTYLAAIWEAQSGGIEVWNMNTKQLAISFDRAFHINIGENGFSVITVASVHENPAVMAFQNGRITPFYIGSPVISPTQGEPIWDTKSPENNWLAYCTSENQLFVFTNADGDLVPLQTNTGEPIPCANTYISINSVALSSHNLLAIADPSGVVKIWEAKQNHDLPF